MSLKAFTARGHAMIENLSPQVDGGRHRAKAIVGDDVEVSADIFRDGPALIQAVVRYRGPSDVRWSESPMSPAGGDRFTGVFTPTELGVYRYTIEAWTDRFGTWRGDLIKRVEAGQNVDVELDEGALMIDARIRSTRGAARTRLAAAAAAIRGPNVPVQGAEGVDPRVAAALDEDVLALMRRVADRRGSVTAKPALEITTDRERARFAAWYEFFPRSTGMTTSHGTFSTATRLLPKIAAMGFDVVYLPPIHPIGKTHRKGKNNSLVAEPGDVGSPWAIGSREGGHKDVHPQLGTIEDFDEFVAACERLGLEVALDYAIQCSPDHPWASTHPEWFHHPPDGSIKHAENPPKKYQDIYPINFDTADKEGLYAELKSILDHWIAHGVKIFRVDNPHTKAFGFWEWVIAELKAEHPDLILLSEAFTRPKVMHALAKLGFTQSYTYFTWRSTKWELTEYLTELSQTDSARYFRPNFFTNTPDILHEYLQTGGPPAFKVRLILASTMSPAYGIYSGFELFENTPAHEGSEEYLNSEKFELKPRNLDGDHNLVAYITRINDIRHKHAALARLTNLTFHNIDNDQLIAYSKMAPDGDCLLVIVNLNPFGWVEGTTALDLDALGIVDPARPFEVHDLITEDTYLWHGPHNYVRLDPSEPAHVFEVRT